MRQKSHYTFRANRVRNRNWQSRCGCSGAFASCSIYNRGQNFITIRNQTSKPIRVRINDFGAEQYARRTFDESWGRFNRFSDLRLFDSEIIQPGATGGGYFFNNPGRRKGGLGRNVFPNTGTLALEVIDPRGNYQALWYEPIASWGKPWVRCGQDYTFTFEETLIQTN